jgi:drug/metabolite transporter (DMT)-like permease
MTRNAPRTGMTFGEWGLLLALAALWGSSFFFFKILVAALPPLTVVLGRVGLAALALNLLLLAGRGRPRGGIRLWASFAVIGLLNNIIPFSLIAFGETRVASGLASIINATTPVFTILAAHVFTTEEKITAPKLAGIGFALVGVVALAGPGTLGVVGQAHMVGELACFGAAISYAFAGIYGRRFGSLPALQVASGQLTASTCILVPMALLVDRPWLLPMPGPHVWLALAGIALLCTALAYVLYFRILATAGATNLLLVTFLLPVSALALGIGVLGESLALREILGLAFIGLGLAAIDGRIARRLWLRPVRAKA